MIQLQLKMQHISSLLMALAILHIDRITKVIALQQGGTAVYCNQFLSCKVVLNRGVSWGLFHSDAMLPFALVTTANIFIIAGLVWYTFERIRKGYAIVGESLVLAGAISNVIDRYVYAGVVDFIALNYKGLSCPFIFNIADIAIVFGVFILCVYHVSKN